MSILHHNPVITCAEAAMARRISIDEELKTVLLKVSYRKVSVHLKASEKIYSKAIRKLFRSKHIRFLTSDELRDYNLEKVESVSWN